MTVRLYLTTGIAISQLTPEKDCRTGALQAGWFPLRQVFDSDPDGSGGLLAPFFAGLHRYLNRYSCEGIKLKAAPARPAFTSNTGCWGHQLAPIVGGSVVRFCGCLQQS